ncbi:AraC family transcriptional regulator [uncultured Algibacter sp.]|uniref:AraC family transcriptional regulator n=1 Tax=uncultured Algibacter sp. TaxID=298659 RepID=UPI002610902C|nr:AraC family transcriptional regulator [uncultured Algibacter sp.]
MRIPEAIFENQKQLLEFLIAPIVSVQLFVTILIYFIIVRRRIASDYKLYIYFLITFIIFIGGRVAEIFLNEFEITYLLLTRMTLLFSIGIPSLLVASVKQSKIKKNKTILITPYILGILISISYILFMLSHRKGALYPQSDLSWLELNQPRLWAHRIQVFGALLLLVIPCTLLIIKEISTSRKNKQLAFLCGTLIFGLAFAIGLGSTPRKFGLYYVGSIISGFFWIWAVFRDIQEMKGKVNIIREELQLLVMSDLSEDVSEIDKLLNNLEELSFGNLDVYKLRIRDILNMLTNVSIEAGGDTNSLISRNSKRDIAIQESSDPKEIRKIITSEAKVLSKILSETTVKNNDRLINQALQHLKNNFTEDLSVEQVAHKVGLSRTHFMREFKKKTGQTFNQYQTSLRIESAKKLLSHKSVSETAYLVGYNTPNYFSTVFKKQTNLSPLEYQKQI